MNWKDFWDSTAEASDKWRQVGRVGGSAPHGGDLLSVIAKHVVEIGDIQPTDVVLDVCCGNGMLTAKLRPYCAHVIGVDFSEKLLNKAKEEFPEITFHVADIAIEDTTILPITTQVERITVCFSFQYFDSVVKGKKVIQHLLRYLKPGGKIILSDIPDRSRMFVYYNTLRKVLSLIHQQVLDKQDMGKFWSEDELNLICNQLGVRGRKIMQPTNLPYSHYRFDYIITR